MGRRGQRLRSEPQVSGASLFAQLYDWAFKWDPSTEFRTLVEIWQRLLGRLPNVVCDLGAGTGRFTLPLLRTGIKTLAVEPDEAMAQILVRGATEWKERFLLIPMQAQRLEYSMTFEAVIAMTDTLSYIWPLDAVRSTLVRIVKHLQGVLVVDVAIWGEELGIQRVEHWSREVGSGRVFANCTARVHGIAAPAVRIEELAFCAEFRNERWFASRQSILHAWTFEQFEGLLIDCGLSPILYFEPTSTIPLPRGEAKHKPRLVIASKVV